MKILTKKTKFKRKIRAIIHKFKNWTNRLSETLKLEKTIKYIQKRYIQTGANIFDINKFQFGYDYEPYLDKLVQAGLIDYLDKGKLYEVTIKEE